MHDRSCSASIIWIRAGSSSSSRRSLNDSFLAPSVSAEPARAGVLRFPAPFPTCRSCGAQATSVAASLRSRRHTPARCRGLRTPGARHDVIDERTIVADEQERPGPLHHCASSSSSVSMSRSLVGSSSTSTFAGRVNSRASSSRFRSPPDSAFALGRQPERQLESTR